MKQECETCKWRESEIGYPSACPRHLPIEGITAQELDIERKEKEHYIHKCIELREREIKPINAGKDDLFCLYCGQPYYEK